MDKQESDETLSATQQSATAASNIDNASAPPPPAEPASTSETASGASLKEEPQKESVAIAATSDNAPTKASPESKRSALETTVIMLSLCSSVFLAALDVSIVSTALPNISAYFHSNAGIMLSLSAYLLGNAASTPSWGKISDIWGRKPILLLAAAIFFIGSVLAATSVNVSMLIAARAIQGIGGGGLIVLVNICISDLFSVRNRGKYFGFVGVVWALASSLGPLLGGAFTEKVSWRWCFYINLPITGSVFILLSIFLHLDNPKTPVWAGLKAVDWSGSLLVVEGIIMLLLGLEFGGITYPWGSAKVVCLIVFGFVVIGLFVVNEYYFARYPVTPVRLFVKRHNLFIFGVCFCHGFVFIPGNYYLPLYFQAVLGATPLLSGVYILPQAIAVSIAASSTGLLIKKTGKYLPLIIFGLSFMTLGFGLFIDFGERANWAKIILYQGIAGLGVGPLFQGPLIALQSNVAPGDIATATATFGFIRSVASAISIVIGGVVFQNQMQKHSGTFEALLGPQLAGALSGGSAGASVGIVNRLPPNQRVIVRDAYTDSLRTMWIMYVCFAALGLVLGFFIGTRTLSRDHTVTKTGLAAEEAKRLENRRKKTTAVIGDESNPDAADIKLDEKLAVPPSSDATPSVAATKEEV